MQFETSSLDHKWIDKTLLRLSNLEHDPVIIHKGNHYFRCGPLTPIRGLLSILTFGKVHELQKALVYDLFRSVEIDCPGASVYLPKFFHEEVELENFKRMSFEDYLNEIKKHAFLQKTIDVIDVLPEVLSGDCRISIKRHKKTQTLIEVREGQKFICSLDSIFQKVSGSDSIQFDFAKVLVIDGSISSISEINGLLEKHAESKEPCLLFCKSFTEEISNTLAVNWLKKKLFVIPLVYGNSIDNINFVADVCGITGALAISPNFGDVISSACLDSDRFSSLSNIKIHGNYMTANSEFNFKPYIQSLVKRVSDETQEDKIEILSNRISNASGNICEINISDKDTDLFEELDSSINILNSFLKSGVAVTNCGLMPYSAYNVCKKNSTNFVDQKQTIGGYLYTT